MRRFRLHDGKQGAALTVRVTPRSRRTGLGGVLQDGTLRVRVAAPASEGRANAALIEFMARVLGVRRSRIEIIAGHTGLDKILSVEDLTAQEAEQRIQTWMERHGVE